MAAAPLVTPHGQTAGVAGVVADAVGELGHARRGDGHLARLLREREAGRGSLLLTARAVGD